MKQFCPQKHDTFICGRLSNHACRLCTAERTRIWRANNPEKLRLTRRYSKLKFFYGVDEKRYNEMFKKQGGLCGICEQPSTNFKRTLSVDHDHVTKQIRGLLCDNCNQGLGHFKDSLLSLERAQDYLRRYKNAPSPR